MFGPNVRGTTDGRSFHHRGIEYADLIHALEAEFGRRFGKHNDYLFLSGSGTFANEAVMFSSLVQFRVLYDAQEFGDRLRRLAENNEAYNSYSPNFALAHYETAIAKEMFLGGDRRAFHFADCVSSLPYYMPPEAAKIWTTVSSKQLGSLPVCSVVAVNKRFWHNLQSDEKYSILNLARYKTSQKKGQSPHTPSIALLADLLERVQDLKLNEFRSWIDERRNTVLNYFGEAASGEGPTVIIDPKAIRRSTAKEFSLYKNAGGKYQLFLYSSPAINMNYFCSMVAK